MQILQILQKDKPNGAPRKSVRLGVYHLGCAAALLAKGHPLHQLTLTQSTYQQQQ